MLQCVMLHGLDLPHPAGRSSCVQRYSRHSVCYFAICACQYDAETLLVLNVTSRSLDPCTVLKAVCQPRCSTCCLQIVAGDLAQTTQLAEVAVSIVDLSIIVCIMYEGIVWEPVAITPSCTEVRGHQMHGHSLRGTMSGLLRLGYGPALQS